MPQPDPQEPAAASPSDDDALEFAREVARIADACKAENVAVLDLRGLSGLTDFFVIGTGSSDRQMTTVLDRVADHARAVQRRALHVSSSRSTAWMLADYVDVVLHLFDGEHREYYDLDGLWGDAPRIEWRRPEAS